MTSELKARPEIVDDLEAALAQFRLIAGDLGADTDVDADIEALV